VFVESISGKGGGRDQLPAPQLFSSSGQTGRFRRKWARRAVIGCSGQSLVGVGTRQNEGKALLFCDFFHHDGGYFAKSEAVIEGDHLSSPDLVSV